MVTKNTRLDIVYQWCWKPASGQTDDKDVMYVRENDKIVSVGVHKNDFKSIRHRGMGQSFVTTGPRLFPYGVEELSTESSSFKQDGTNSLSHIHVTAAFLCGDFKDQRNVIIIVYNDTLKANSAV